MKALSIRQPWAWLIVNGGKDIENRSWPTKFRGRFLVHAAKGMTRAEYEDALDLVQEIGSPDLRLRFPAFEDLQRGGIVGSVELVDCVSASDSPWYMGVKGFVLHAPRPTPFVPMTGSLGFFEAGEEPT